MRRIFILVLLLLTLSVGYGQTISTLNGAKFTLSANSANYISLLGDRVRFSLQGSERDTFIKLLDVSIELLDGASKLNLTDGTMVPVLYLELSNSVRINTSIKMLSPEPVVTFYIQNLGSYDLIDFTKANLQEWRAAFLVAYDQNRKITSSRQSLQELVLSMQGKFNAK